MTNFNPNAAANKNAGIFGLPYSLNQSKLVLLPIPWEATTSYGGGTAQGPHALFHASMQIDLFDLDLGNFYEQGIFMKEIPEIISKWNTIAYQAARKVIELNDETKTKADIDVVNNYSEKLNTYVYEETKKILSQNKLAGLIGGDHSTPFGSIKAHLEKYPNMSVLHIDAHADLRNAFEGFEYSHASIMHNVIEKTDLKKLVQVGIRDFCEEEFNYIKTHSNRITTFFDSDLSEKKLCGTPWLQLCDDIISSLNHEVYISFDIDGLDPRFCPHTGTPVPGGLDFNELNFLFKKISQSGRNIIGFDLNEVSPGINYQADNPSTQAADEWDANVGARLLYKLCGWALREAI